MKKNFLIISLSFALLLGGCGNSSAISQKSSELSSQYEYYQKSADNIQKYMDVDPEQADSIFLVLVDCGVSDLINIITKNTDGTFSTWSAGTEYIVSLNNGSVSSVYIGEDQLYPENIHHNNLMDYDLIVKDVMNGSGDAVIGQYAYISITANQLKEMTADNLREFSESVVSGASYNWISIIATDGTGICFTGCDTSSAIYGKLDKDGSVIETFGEWSRNENGDYSYSEQ